MRRATNAAECWPKLAGHGKTCRRPTARNCAVMEPSEQTVDATGAVWTLRESVVALAGAQIPAECGNGSRTQQITRKRLYKTLDLWRHKSLMAMTTPGRPFCVITRKEIARSAKSRQQERVNELRRKTGANPGNAGVQPGATSLVFRRGVGPMQGVGFGRRALTGSER